MTKDEHNKMLNDLKSATTDVDRMALIMQLEKDYTGILSERDVAITNATKSQEEAAKFAKLNNELWLANSSQEKVGQTTSIVESVEHKEDVAEKRTFEALESKFD